MDIDTRYTDEEFEYMVGDTVIEGCPDDIRESIERKTELRKSWHTPRPISDEIMQVSNQAIESQDNAI